jgi:predicted GTPase
MTVITNKNTASAQNTIAYTYAIRACDVNIVTKVHVGTNGKKRAVRDPAERSNRLQPKTITRSKILSDLHVS